ncbi:Pyrrolo-quinoline quinone [Rhizorhabdus wittichii RW1]|uniref:Pyrrolo-quinoline quinone n=1 Tax=Rhizorhabdus wittichii (strain DSM 6014 / CCUG 31198 / JCM 15750 / NBRC 105917 / EY 4224 / RW1) TaxID=392499 RepID=A0A9J9HB46_RHIWR|nr:Pyrrolo-quinoline quinone [Rhizorhabdus wittichii RW1]
MVNDEKSGIGARRMLERAFAGISLLAGMGMALPGAYLLTLGGSTYYLVAGVLLVAAAVDLWRGRARGAWLFLLVWLGTLGWALWEAGLDGWALLPRLGLLTGMGIVLALIRWRPGARTARIAATATAAAALLASISLVLTGSHGNASLPLAASTAAGVADGEWHHIGRTVGADRFSPLDQITPANIGKLQVAWTAHLGMPPKGLAGTIEATPLMVGDTLYTCNMDNAVIAIDPDSGKTRWAFDPKLNVDGLKMTQCRGVTYHRQPGISGPCAERIILTTYDNRLFALDAHGGQRCRDFGNNGEVSLLDGMGGVPKGYYYQTSPAALVRDKLIVGGCVLDGQAVNEPSGVIRAFDAVTGRLAWAWDMGRPDRQGLPPAGETYTRGTPNAWPPISGDDRLGLAFVPLGNPTPDYVMSHRTPEMRRYGSSVVALDVETGKERWHYQTTHLDVWDYDLPAPASLVDFPTARGLRPALIQPTKRGQFFVLDRETGKPLVETVERAVPQGAAPGESLSPTQPYPVGMPSLAGPRLSEARMWGITPFDQIWCRIRFRQARYDGDFTPVGTDKPSIIFPGMWGGSTWSGISIDPERRIMVANVNHFPMYNRLVRRADADPKEYQQFVAGRVAINSSRWSQTGTPYAAKVEPFMSPLKIPCSQPPYSEIAAIDLGKRAMMWRHPVGRARNTGPFNIATGVPFVVGTPTLGGSMVTRSGLVFIAATQEPAFRAYDLRTGKLVWETRLPTTGHGNPMTYRSPRSGRQFVLIPASGHPRFLNTASDQLIAYALPE